MSERSKLITGKVRHDEPKVNQTAQDHSNNISIYLEDERGLFVVDSDKNVTDNQLFLVRREKKLGAVSWIALALNRMGKHAGWSSN